MSSFFHDIRAKKSTLPVFIALVLFYAASYFQRTAIPGTTFEFFQRDCNLTAENIAGLSASMMYVYAFCQLVVGLLADKYCGIRIVSIAGLIFCVGVVAFPFCLASLPLMYFCRALTGLGASALYLSLVKEIDRVFGRQNYAILLGIVYFVGYSGGLFGTLPFSALCEHYNWVNLLICVGMISLVLYLIFMATRHTVPVPPVASQKLSLMSFWKVLKNPLMWAPMFCGCVNFGCHSITQMVFGVKFLRDFSKMSPNAASATVFFQTFVCMFALLGGGIWTRSIMNRRKPLMVLSTVSAFLSTVLMLAALHFHLSYVCFVICFMLFALASGLSIAFTMVCQEVNSRENMTLSAGVLNAVDYLVIAVFSVLIGKLLDSFVSAETLAKGSNIIYPENAYVTLFLLLLIPTGISLVISFLIPDTGGHYFHHANKQ